MNVIDKYTTQVVHTSSVSGNSFKKDSMPVYKDPLRTWPVKGLAYSNELGAVVSEISPKLGSALWVPALMYFGADIYDKYRNDKESYDPSARRGLKQALFQYSKSLLFF